MRRITRTIYGNALQTARHLGINHEIDEVAGNDLLENAVDSLNSIDTRFTPSAAAYNPSSDVSNNHLRYIAIGNGAHKTFTGAGGVQYSAPIPHRSRDVGLYNWTPFVVRKLDPAQGGADLPAGDPLNPTVLTQASYRFRRILVIGGEFYAAYYLRLLDVSSAVVSRSLIQESNGSTTVSAFTPGATDLQPTAPNITDPGVIPNDGEYLKASASMSIDFTADEITEYQNAIELIYGNKLLATVSEVALCSGVDRPSSNYFAWPQIQNVEGGATPESQDISANGMYEAVGVQANTFITSVWPLAYANDGFGFSADLGATEALFGAGSL